MVLSLASRVPSDSSLVLPRARARVAFDVDATGLSDGLHGRGDDCLLLLPAAFLQLVDHLWQRYERRHESQPQPSQPAPCPKSALKVGSQPQSAQRRPDPAAGSLRHSAPGTSGWRADGPSGDTPQLGRSLPLDIPLRATTFATAAGNPAQRWSRGQGDDSSGDEEEGDDSVGERRVTALPPGETPPCQRHETPDMPPDCIFCLEPLLAESARAAEPVAP